MTKSLIEPVANAPGVFTFVSVESRQGDRLRAMVHGQIRPITAEDKKPDLVVSGTVNPGYGAVALGLSGIWDAAKDLTGRAWDAISDVLTNEGGSGGGGGGGGGARIIASTDEAEIVTTTRAPAL